MNDVWLAAEAGPVADQPDRTRTPVSISFARRTRTPMDGSAWSVLVLAEGGTPEREWRGLLVCARRTRTPDQSYL